jgi:hypothetical protein
VDSVRGRNGLNIKICIVFSGMGEKASRRWAMVHRRPEAAVIGGPSSPALLLCRVIRLYDVLQIKQTFGGMSAKARLPALIPIHPALSHFLGPVVIW